MSKRSDSHPALSGLFPKPNSKSSPAPVLITESRQAYKRLRRDVKKEIVAKGAIERMFLADIFHLQWEIRRWRRVKVALLNAAFRDALPSFLAELLCDPGDDSFEFREKGAELASAWFSDQDTQQLIAQRLEKFGLDETAISTAVPSSTISTACSRLRSRAGRNQCVHSRNTAIRFGAT